MSVGFYATSCQVTEENGIIVIALGAFSNEDDDFYLMLQHKKQHDEQDVKFGMNKPCIEYCGQGWSWYGHILSFLLLRDHVCIRMDGEAAAHMNNDGFIEVTFDLVEAEFANLRYAMHTTFGG